MKWNDDSPESRRIFAEELALVDASELLADCMEKVGVSRSELAERLGVTKSEVSQRLGGGRNLTLKKLAAMLDALGYELVLGAKHTGTAPLGGEWARTVALIERAAQTPAWNLNLRPASQDSGRAPWIPEGAHA